jgi:glycosyltransferase involved in cell wall biosynthesis
MRLLVLSWRYLGHPQAGGAEVLTHEILRRLVDRGYHVTAFTGADRSLPAEQHIDGVRVLRSGRQWTVHIRAWLWLRRRIACFDRIVDQINTIPFFTPAYVPTAKRRGWIHQLAREYWWTETRGPFRLIAPLGYLAEPLYLRAYRSTEMLSLSESTAADLRGVGVAGDRISLVPAAIEFEPLEEVPPAEPGLRIVMLSRLTPAKHIEEGIAAYALVKRRHPGAELIIAGSGDGRYEERLRRQVSRSGLTGVQFRGRVSDSDKRALLRSAFVHLFTSHREGWGLVVSEAAALGTPSVGYDVPGVRDSIVDPRLLGRCGRPETLADRIGALAAEPGLYDELRRRAWERATSLSYDDTTDRFEAALA